MRLIAKRNQNELERVFISGQKRGVFGIIKRELRRRSAMEPVIGHMKAEATSDVAISKAAQESGCSPHLCSRSLEVGGMMPFFSKDQVAKTAQEIADTLQLVPQVKALQQGQKEIADAMAKLSDRIPDMERPLKLRRCMRRQRKRERS